MSSPAIRKLKREYAALKTDPPHPGIFVRPLESNFLHAHFLVMGEVFHDTPYEGGVYHGVLKFPKEYPFKPPSIIMRTPSGRFKVNEKICFSMSDFHPESWQPSWTIRTILSGFVSFMNGNDITTGGIDAPAPLRIKYAQESLRHAMESDDLAMKIFDDVLENIQKERADLGSSWPPTRSVSTAKVTKSSQEKTFSASARASTAPPVEQGSGKNASRNKKKREKEKRKKAAAKFLSDLNEQVPSFVLSIAQALLTQYDIDVSNLEADHVCYRTDSMEQYESLVEALKSDGNNFSLLVESEIGGRQIATFKLSTPISVKVQESAKGGWWPIGSAGVARFKDIDVIEIPSPKEGSPYKAGLEHIEFVIGDVTHHSPMNGEAHQSALKGWMEKYPSVDWNSKALEKECNPDVSTKIEIEQFGHVSAKFHLISLENVIKFEIDSSN